MSFSKQLTDEYSKEEARAEQYSLLDYDNPPDGCPMCHRHRVCICANGKHRCEKCDFVIEDNKYLDLSY